MNTYEALFLVDPTQASTNWEKTVKHVGDLLTKQEAKILKESKWAERKLAYPVQRQKRGAYLLVYFEAPSASIAKIKNDCQLSEVILRVLILRATREMMARMNKAPEETPAPGSKEKKTVEKKEAVKEK